LYRGGDHSQVKGTKYEVLRLGLLSESRNKEREPTSLRRKRKKVQGRSRYSQSNFPHGPPNRGEASAENPVLGKTQRRKVDLTVI